MKKIYQHIIDSPKLIISVLLSVALLFLGVGLLAGRIISQKDDGHVPLNLSVNSSNSSIVIEENMREEKKTYKETSKETIPVINYVDVKGAVNRPGIYSFSLEERVHDVIEKAGGLTDTADGNQINLAAKLTDQQLIYVPVIGEEIPEVAKGKQSHPVEETEKTVRKKR